MRFQAGLIAVVLCVLHYNTVQSQDCSFPETCNKHNHPTCRDGLVKDYRAKRVTKMELRSKLCGNGKNMFCCYLQKTAPLASVRSPSTRRITTTRRPQPNTQSPDSPSYIPSAENDDCGYFEDISNIVGGEKTKPGIYPFTVALGKWTRGGKIAYQCGGTLINKWFVLTAAHCKKEIDGGLADIGDWKISTSNDCFSRGKCLPTNQIIDIQALIPHAGFKISKTNVENDIMLVKLGTMVEYNDQSVVPACLPLGRFDLNVLGISNFENGIDGVRAHAVGWGKTQVRSLDTFSKIVSETLSSATTDVQRKVDLPLQTENKCKQSFPAVRYDKQLCAGGETGRDTCNGDSGGPLVINKFSKITKNLTPDTEDSRWYLIGIVSFGSSRCGTGLPGVFTRVSAHLDWIKQNLK